MRMIAHSADVRPETRYHAAVVAAKIHFNRTGETLDPQQEAEIGAQKATVRMESNQRYLQEHSYHHDHYSSSPPK